MYEKNNNDEMIDPMLANTALIFANAIFYYNDRVSILMAKQI